MAFNKTEKLCLRHLKVFSQDVQFFDIKRVLAGHPAGYGLLANAKPRGDFLLGNALSSYFSPDI